MNTTALRSKKNNLLKSTLRANSVFSGLVAVELLLFHQKIANFMGSFDPKYLIWLGLVLIFFVIILLYVTERGRMSLSMAKFVVWLDVSWVVGSSLLMIFVHHWFSNAGLILMTAVAIVVALFATYQCIGIKQFSKNDALY